LAHVPPKSANYPHVQVRELNMAKAGTAAVNY
jgi:hypothetical protein